MRNAIKFFLITLAIMIFIYYIIFVRSTEFHSSQSGHFEINDGKLWLFSSSSFHCISDVKTNKHGDTLFLRAYRTTMFNLFHQVDYGYEIDTSGINTINLQDSSINVKVLYSILRKEKLPGWVK